MSMLTGTAFRVAIQPSPGKWRLSWLTESQHCTSMLDTLFYFRLEGDGVVWCSPSADNVDGFVERSRVESGQLIGPRIFTVGDIIYGAGAGGIHQDIVDSAEAYSALKRIKAEGGPASISYKNYNIPSRYVPRISGP